MRHRLKNVTVTLDPDLARWVRIEAARGDVSVSRFLADLLRERMEHHGSYQAAKERAIARASFLKTDGRYLSREEAHRRSE